MNALKKLGIILLIIIALPLLAAIVFYWLVSGILIAAAVVVCWIPRGRRFLIVYSDSAQWKSYFEEAVIPRCRDRAKIINLSLDGGKIKWWWLSGFIYKQLYHNYRNSFPLVIRFSFLGTWRTVRFYDAFMKAKKGEIKELEMAKARVEAWLDYCEGQK